MSEGAIDTVLRMFPWIGGAAAAVLLVLLFGTRALRRDPAVSRWRDPVWLAWAAVATYLLHNVEEYGIDLFGRRLGFPDGFCAALNQPPFPDCSIPPLFFLAVNIPLFWIAAPVAAVMSRRHALVGLTFYGVIFVNAWLHIVPLAAGRGYSSGTFTAVVLFVPLSFWVARACFGPRGMRYQAMVVLIALGVLVHLLLMLPMQMFLRAWISGGTLVASQMVNPVAMLLVPWLAERWRDRA